MNVLKDTYAPVKLPLDILDNSSEIYLNYLRRVCVLFVHAFRSAVANLAPTVQPDVSSPLLGVPRPLLVCFKRNL